MNRRFFLTTICMAFGAISLPKIPAQNKEVFLGKFYWLSDKGVPISPVDAFLIIQT